MHEVRVEHDWQETGERRLESGAQKIYVKCRNCGQERTVIDLGRVCEQSLIELPKEERKAEFRKLSKMGRDFLENIAKLDRWVVSGSRHDDIPSLLEEIEKRYPHALSAGEMSYRYLRLWAEKSNRKSKRKLLLLIRQGFVCNRCHRIVPSSDLLTEDHITPRSAGGESVLTNLQLLCRRCNEEKGSEDPDGRDISPFRWNGPSCIHRVTCFEIDELRRLYKLREENPR